VTLIHHEELNKVKLCSVYYEYGHWCFSSYKVLAHSVNETTNSTVEACIENIKDFTSVFLFSLEIQTTIGFGHSQVSQQFLL